MVRRGSLPESTQMHRKLFWLPLVLLLAMLLWLVTKDAAEQRRDGEAGITAGGAPEMMPATVVSLPDEDPAVPAAAIASGAVVDGGSSASQAFRFLMEEGRVSLQQVDDLKGGWRERRGQLPWWPGMLYYRLLDAEGHLLAEETQAAPDYQCVVMDPRSKGPDGKPMAVHMTQPEPVVFQVRMPKDPRAAKLEVYRLTGPRGGPREPTAGIQLASISIPR